MQVIIGNIALVMQLTMWTTAAESLNAAGNIFIGQSESTLLIRPFVNDLTRSELHAVLTSGFTTIAGSAMAAYIEMGIAANHLFSASVMSAPAALAMSKLFYPETEVSKTTYADVTVIEKPQEKNVIEAAATGALQSIKLSASIIVNLIAFISTLAFVNATTVWIFERVGLGNVTFEFICSYPFYPFAIVMGVDIVDARKVAELLALKTFLSEYVAYDRLSRYSANGKRFTEHLLTNGTYTSKDQNILLLSNNGTVLSVLTQGLLAEKSILIATYALCGFANIASIGCMIGVITAIAPQRKSDVAKLSVRALIAATAACFMTACIAGLLYSGK